MSPSKRKELLERLARWDRRLVDKKITLTQWFEKTDPLIHLLEPGMSHAPGCSRPSHP